MMHQMLNKKDSATHSTLPYLNTSISWGVVPTDSVANRRGSAESLSLKVDSRPGHIQTTKQISFQDQDSSSTQSTGQSYTEVASSGDDNPSRQISFSAKSGSEITQRKGFASNPKQGSMTGFPNIHFAPAQVFVTL
jgi:nuclear transcription factor Y alpha